MWVIPQYSGKLFLSWVMCVYSSLAGIREIGRLPTSSYRLMSSSVGFVRIARFPTFFEINTMDVFARRVVSLIHGSNTVSKLFLAESDLMTAPQCGQGYSLNMQGCFSSIMLSYNKKLPPQFAHSPQSEKTA